MAVIGIRRPRPPRRLRVAVTLAVVICAATASAARAATIVVTSHGDDSAVNGSVSLREAIESIDAGANIIDIVAGTLSLAATSPLTGCSGSVRVSVLRGRRVLAAREGRLSQRCSYSVRIAVGVRAGKTLQVRCAGDARLTAMRSRAAPA